MAAIDPFIPVRVARLIIEYLRNSSSDAGKAELDAWLVESDEHQTLFESLTEGVDHQVISEDEILADTESLIDQRVIGALILRQQGGLNNEVEEAYLNRWLEMSQNDNGFKF